MKRSHPPSLTEGTNNNNIQNKTNKSSISEYNFQTLELIILLSMKSLLLIMCIHLLIHSYTDTYYPKEKFLRENICNVYKEREG